MNLRDSSIGGRVRRHARLHAFIHATWCRVFASRPAISSAGVAGGSTGGGGSTNGGSPTLNIIGSTTVAPGTAIQWTGYGFPSNIVLSVGTGLGVQNTGNTGPTGATSGSFSTASYPAGSYVLTLYDPSDASINATADFTVQSPNNNNLPLPPPSVAPQIITGNVLGTSEVAYADLVSFAVAAGVWGTNTSSGVGLLATYLIRGGYTNAQVAFANFGGPTDSTYGQLSGYRYQADGTTVGS